MTEEFARAFWQDGKPQKHLLGMSVVENPLRYVALFLEKQDQCERSSQ
jgi:hypothetical protein